MGFARPAQVGCACHQPGQGPARRQKIEGGHAQMLTLTGLEQVKDYVGKELGVSDWLLVTQEKIDEFAVVTGDDQWIHVDIERAKQSPFGGTIAHGYFTLSLAPRFSYDMFSFEGFAFGINYGLNRLRFPAPMPVGGRVRMRAKLLSVEEIPGGAQLATELTFEREGGEKPVCVAESLSRVYSG
jgi:acyl dehydratase